MGLEQELSEERGCGWLGLARRLVRRWSQRLELWCRLAVPALVLGRGDSGAVAFRGAQRSNKYVVESSARTDELRRALKGTKLPSTTRSSNGSACGLCRAGLMLLVPALLPVRKSFFACSGSLPGPSPVLCLSGTLFSESRPRCHCPAWPGRWAGHGKACWSHGALAWLPSSCGTFVRPLPPALL